MEDKVVIWIAFIGAYLFSNYQAYKIGRIKHGMQFLKTLREDVKPNGNNVDTLIKVVEVLEKVR